MIKCNVNMILVDSSKAFIEELKLTLIKIPNYYVQETWNNGTELIESPHLQKADIIILEVQIPVIKGIEVAKKINLKYPTIKILALSMHIDKVFLEDLIGAGVKGFIYKPETSQKLNEVIKKILSGHLVFPDNQDINIMKK